MAAVSHSHTQRNRWQNPASKHWGVHGMWSVEPLCRQQPGQHAIIAQRSRSSPVACCGHSVSSLLAPCVLPVVYSPQQQLSLNTPFLLTSFPPSKQHKNSTARQLRPVPA